ncbi:Aldose 1-epimerase [Paenibacillus plantiphilus]|uniref:Aldose 1-epimerase n=1 Tax=Paenibacillus plantiphilus TaxID=2905650 RepID=A0ABN8GDV4_9BACL|nr:aldose 1-epimerase [Paenibacillus plantiphilus]CAH1206358.1 Aldose 1-epimerase [Paenibacillus plantiphilus]
MRQHRAYEGIYQGEKAIWLEGGRYEAALLPDNGGNLIAFRDIESGYRFLREPDEEEGMKKFKARPFVYGIPVLFPPNRYRDGKFLWKGQTYQFPVNEAETGNHLHGFFTDIPWEVVEFGSTRTESFVTVTNTVDEQHVAYPYFPHKFTIKLRYSISEDGLSQQVIIRNEGDDEMPCLLAFHTAINAPFAPGSTARDCRVRVTIGERWELDERMLPTGSYQQLTAEDEQLRDSGIYPFLEEMDNHYRSAPQNGRNRMELADLKQNVTLIYDVGASFKQWMIWNNFAIEGFICPEPQTNLINAPNMNLPAEEMGLFSLKPGEIWEETGRLYVK